MKTKKISPHLIILLVIIANLVPGHHKQYHWSESCCAGKVALYICCSPPQYLLFTSLPANSHLTMQSTGDANLSTYCTQLKAAKRKEKQNTKGKEWIALLQQHKTMMTMCCCIISAQHILLTHLVQVADNYVRCTCHIHNEQVYITISKHKLHFKVNCTQ